ncbi:YeeE/YedE thiosulfate transporter family protein [Pseudooceanicola onchidii]|uniref:YeeE/YedE thiosulfate transporter family protein n=1 Tax=Pseudooceanicola onchidii TaxID=2562279 RepID=UPI0010AB2C54|nr:YeeE/YedE thiosulfate transporter family protein [Pseudooceanicola onchidii]
MYESFGFDTLTPQQASLWFALGLGLVFGLLAAVTKFCFRRALVGEDRRAARGVWALALAVAILGTQGAVAAGLIDFAGHRYVTGDMPVLAIALGGLLFGAGMILTRGCVSRLVVLTGAGNLRAALVLVVFAVVAHATLKGVLAPVRTTLGSVTWSVGEFGTLAALPGGLTLWSVVLAALALVFVVRSGNPVSRLVLAAAIGLLVPLGWVGTGYVLYDEFDPITLESLSFIAPMTEGLFWTIASTAVPAGFGTGLIGGALLGGLIAALALRSFEWQSFATPAQTGRYILGATLMGFGGVLAGGCTIGAGLAGVPTLGVAALLALGFICIGGVATDRLLLGRALPAALAQPAE